ncbi:hypothetical protein DTO166G5_4095 [Paecilomyces variotii]|nr:hypothetical protein DTO166G5_4095 [Paecilomyces variotii]
MALPFPPKNRSEESNAHEIDGSIIDSGSLKFTLEAGENSSLPTYQEASGAPVEVKSPLGYSVGPITIICLNLSKMIGTGVFSTPSSVMKGAGSVGLAFIYWTIGYLMAFSNLAVYLEFASYFPSRSGSEVVYFEQSFPRPKYFFPTVFAMQTVVLSFSSSNAVVLAQYLYKLADSTGTDWEYKGVAIASYTVAVLCLAFNTKWSLRFANAISVVKFITLVFVGITGLVVLGGNTRVKDPTANFRNAFSGSSKASPYGATNALVKVMFSYAGYENAFNVVNEVKNPVKTLRWSAPVSLTITAVLYILANVAYFSAATTDEILKSENTAASVFFENVFGSGGASRALNCLICLSAFGNLLAVLIGQSRMLRECGRQGVLPWTNFWTSTRPFGTPLGPYFVKWALTIIMIIAPPFGDAFNFVVDLALYPTSFFTFILGIGLLVTRYRRKKIGFPPASYRAWDIVVWFSIISNLYMLVMPWYPPDTGADGGDVSFWYATYCAAGLGIIALCGVYYYIWVKVLPRIGKYELRQTIIELDGGGSTHKLIRVPRSELSRWDAEHDATGRLRHRTTYEAKSEGTYITTES